MFSCFYWNEEFQHQQKSKQLTFPFPSLSGDNSSTGREISLRATVTLVLTNTEKAASTGFKSNLQLACLLYKQILVQPEFTTLGKTVHVRYKRGTGLICSVYFLKCVFDYLSTIKICSLGTDLIKEKSSFKKQQCQWEGFLAAIRACSEVVCT